MGSLGRLELIISEWMAQQTLNKERLPKIPSMTLIISGLINNRISYILQIQSMLDSSSELAKHSYSIALSQYDKILPFSSMRGFATLNLSSIE